MAKIPVRDRTNKAVGEIEVADTVFGRPVRRSLLHEAVVHHQASLRRGTHKTKTKSEVKGSGRKPWRQKGTGRARVGMRRSPLWRSGGVTFGPRPRAYSYRLGGQKQRHALQMALTVKQRDGQIVILDDLKVEEAKTRLVAALLAGLELGGKVLIYDPDGDASLARAARNLPGVKVVHDYGLNVYDLLLHEWLLTSRAGIQRIDEALR